MWRGLAIGDDNETYIYHDRFLLSSSSIFVLEEYKRTNVNQFGSVQRPKEAKIKGDWRGLIGVIVTLPIYLVQKHTSDPLLVCYRFFARTIASVELRPDKVNQNLFLYGQYTQ
jgi:hypothetical protein